MSQKKTRRVGVRSSPSPGCCSSQRAPRSPSVRRSRLVNEPTADIGVHPSTGQPAELTLVENGVIHFRAFADGTGISRGPCAVPSPSRPCPRTESAMPPAGSSRGSAATASSSRRAAPSKRAWPPPPSTARARTPTAPHSASIRPATPSSTPTVSRSWTSSRSTPTARRRRTGRRGLLAGALLGRGPAPQPPLAGSMDAERGARGLQRLPCPLPIITCSFCWSDNFVRVYQGSTRLSSRVPESHLQFRGFGATKRLK